MEEYIFIVRIWCEHREIEGEQPRFRVMVQRAETGEKQYFGDLSSLLSYIRPYIAQTNREQSDFDTYMQQLSEVIERPSTT